MAGRISAWPMAAQIAAALLIGGLGGGAEAANWQTILADAGRSMELDRASIRTVDGGKVVAWGRIVFDKPVPDTVSGGTYRLIEALNRYDCKARSFTTLKRIYRKNAQEVLREEENTTPVQLPVRSGTLDDKILKIACRPSGIAGIRQDFDSVVREASEAAAEMRRANEAMVKQEAKKDGKKEILKADLSDGRPAAKAKPRGVAPVTLRTTPRDREIRPASRLPGSLATRRAATASVSEIPWSYDGTGGPDTWAKLQPDFRACGSGLRQSPIDLRDAIRVDQPEIEFRYQPSRFRIVDTDHALEIALAADNGFTLLGRDYRLVRAHFHRPGEHRIDGQAFEMSVHLEHRSDDGQVAILAINLVAGREHPVVQTLWNHLPLERYEVVAPPETRIDPGQLLPASPGYFHYMGSLTAPPCTEGVVWLVMKQAVEVSPEQIAIYARLHAANSRPLQAAQGRRVKESR